MWCCSSKEDDKMSYFMWACEAFLSLIPNTETMLCVFHVWVLQFPPTVRAHACINVRVCLSDSTCGLTGNLTSVYPTCHCFSWDECQLTANKQLRKQMCDCLKFTEERNDASLTTNVWLRMKCAGLWMRSSLSNSTKNSTFNRDCDTKGEHTRVQRF